MNIHESLSPTPRCVNIFSDSGKVRQPPDSQRDLTGWPSKSFWDILLPAVQVRWMDCSLAQHGEKHAETTNKNKSLTSRIANL